MACRTIKAFSVDPCVAAGSRMRDTGATLDGTAIPPKQKLEARALPQRSVGNGGVFTTAIPGQRKSVHAYVCSSGLDLDGVHFAGDGDIVFAYHGLQAAFHL